MLNRRSLRIKAVQHYFGYLLCRQATADLCRDQIKETLQPDRNSMEPDYATNWALLAEESIRYFNTLLEEPMSLVPKDMDTRAVAPAREAYKKYLRDARADYTSALNKLQHELEKLEKGYHGLMYLTVETWRYCAEKTNPGNPRHNSTVEQLAAYPAVSNGSIWDPTSLTILIEEIYKTARKNEELKNELKREGATTDEDTTALAHVFRNIIFETGYLHTAMEEWDYNWQENKTYLKDTIGKTFKFFSERAAAGQALMQLSADWEADTAFIIRLFEETDKQERENRDVIIPTLKNWDWTRIASVEQCLMLMAIAEMRSFPSIPVKATINEFIEITKIYAGPTSKPIINGVLDTVSKSLTQKGIIKKSGRGLIDHT